MYITSDEIFNVMKRNEKTIFGEQLKTLIKVIEDKRQDIFVNMVFNKDVRNFKLITTSGITFDIDSNVISLSGITFGDVLDLAIKHLNRKHKSFFNLNSSISFTAETNLTTGYYTCVRIKLIPGLLTPIPNI